MPGEKTADWGAVPAASPGGLADARVLGHRMGETCNLLRDCLLLWNIPAHVTPAAGAMAIDTPDGRFTLQFAPAELRPVRWFLQTPARAAAGRPPRALPSIVAVLSALRNTLGGDAGSTLRIGTGRMSA